MDGAWRSIRLEVISPDSTYVGTRSGLVVISGRYLSQVWLFPDQPGARQTSQPGTIEQKAARLDAMFANEGTVEIRDTLMLLHFDQSESVDAVGTTMTVGLHIGGDTLVVSQSFPWEKDSSRLVHHRRTFVRQR